MSLLCTSKIKRVCVCKYVQIYDDLKAFYIRYNTIALSSFSVIKMIRCSEVIPKITLFEDEDEVE